MILSLKQGIAPTLITFRVATGQARVDEEWAEPVSTIAFRVQESSRDTTTIEETVTHGILGHSMGASSVPQAILDGRKEDFALS